MRVLQVAGCLILLLMSGLLQKSLFCQHPPVGKYTLGGAHLEIHDDLTFSYSSFECYHLVEASGNVSVKGDTLFLDNLPLVKANSLINAKVTSADVSGIRITLRDTTGTSPEGVTVVVSSGGKLYGGQSDSLGKVDLGVSGFDSIRVHDSGMFALPNSVAAGQEVLLYFPCLNIMDMEVFDHRPYLMRGKKLWLLYEGEVSRGMCFRRVR